MYQEPIFEQKEEAVSFVEGSTLSFKGCPNKCINGYFVDPYKHKKVLCSYCEEKRKKLVKHDIELKEDADLNSVLRLMPTFEGLGNCTIDNILMKKSKALDMQSYDRIVEKLQDLLNKVSVGELPDESLMFNMGDLANWNSYIDAYLVRSYMSGLTTAPFLFIDDLIYSKRVYDLGLDDTDAIDYKLITSSDTCLVFIDSGVTIKGIYAVKGLMEVRARYNKSTILFLKSFNPELKNALNSLKSFGEKRFDLVNDYMIIYKKAENDEDNKDKQDSFLKTPQNQPALDSRMGMSNSQFSQLFSTRNNL